MSRRKRLRQIEDRLSRVPDSPWYVYEVARREDRVWYAIASLPDNDVLITFDPTQVDYRVVELLVNAHADIGWLLQQVKRPKQWWRR